MPAKISAMPGEMENSGDEEEMCQHCPVSFLEARHCEAIEGEKRPTETWRMKERMKTVSVALTLCLNIGVDPPDVVKPQPCARLECWIDPAAMNQQKALETIGAALQKQYERWQPKARYKLRLDPTGEDVKNLCMSLRRNAKDERVLFHYNGHGVPKPTKNGEIWVFNERYTQYIPLSIYDLQTWMSTPSIFVWDCNNAGLVVECFRQFAEQHEKEMLNAAATGASGNGGQAVVQNGNGNQTAKKNSNEVAVGDPPSSDHHQPAVNGITTHPPTSSSSAATTNAPAQQTIPNFRDCIQLGACQTDQILPTNPELPADLFTACLTTPIKVAILWYILQNNLTDKLPLDIIDKIPGQLSDRRTLLGELNWILTAITDTIAWNTLPRELFQTLFRQDLLVASLFRNFLLADRVMRSYHCTPVSSPELPSTADNPMWQAWDSVLDAVLPRLDGSSVSVQPVPSIPLSQSSAGLSEMGGSAFEYTHSTFFANELTAFEVWLECGYDHRDPPQQLPIVLQVLLSQVHRVRALELLGRFLDLGSWAVSLALSVGIFPYVLKLLQSFVKELRPLLSFIWAKILAVDPDCQGDLIREGGHRYFLQILSDPTVSCEQKIVPAFVLASIMDDNTSGQEAIMQGGFISICMDLFNDCKSSLLRQWLAIGLGRLWSDFDAARGQGIRCTAYEKLDELLDDPAPEVRASAVYALGTLISNRSDQNEHATHTDHSITMNLVQKVRGDASPLVRKELIVALHWLVLNFEKQFVTIAYQLFEERMRAIEEHQLYVHNVKEKTSTTPNTNGSVSHGRQSSLSIVDNASINNLVHGGGSATIPRQNSMHNISSSPSSSALSPGSKITPASSLANLFGLGSPWATAARTGHRGSMILDANRDTLWHLENRLLNMSFQGLGALSNVYSTVWRAVLTLANDPHPEVASLAEKLVDHVNNEAMQLRRAKSESEDTVVGMKSPHAHRRSLAPGLGGYATAVPSPSASEHGTDTVDSVARSAYSALQRPTFVIGSPSDVAAAVAAAGATATSPVTQLASPRQAHEKTPRTPRTRLPPSRSSATSTDSPSGGEGTPSMSVYSTIYTGLRRPMFDSGPGAQKEQESPNRSPRSTGRKPALLKTEFVNWCAKRFTRPILHLLNDETARDEPKPMSEMPLTDWAIESIDAIRTKSQSEWRSLSRSSSSPSMRLDLQTFINRNPRPPYCLQFFHLYPLLCVGEANDINLWNWRNGEHVGSFPNSQHKNVSFGQAGRVTTLQIVNPLTHGFLMTGTDSGEVRIFDCNIASQFDLYNTSQQQVRHGTVTAAASHVWSTGGGLEKLKPKLVTAWTPTYDVVRFGPFTSAGRIRTEYFWEQDSASLIVAGDFKTLRVWDARSEQKVQEFAIGPDQRTVTSISADYHGHNLVAVGTSDGDVRVYDRRVPPDENRVMKFRDLDKAIVKVHLQKKQFGSQLVAGSENGQIRVWDPRMFQDPVVTCQLDDTSPVSTTPGFFSDMRVSAMDVHEEYELMALSTADTHTVHLLSLSGKTLNTIRYHDGFMGQKLSDIRCLKFHPYLISLGLGSADNVVAAYGVST